MRTEFTCIRSSLAKARRSLPGHVRPSGLLHMRGSATPLSASPTFPPEPCEPSHARQAHWLRRSLQRQADASLNGVTGLTRRTDPIPRCHAAQLQAARGDDVEPTEQAPAESVAASICSVEV